MNRTLYHTAQSAVALLATITLCLVCSPTTQAQTYPDSKGTDFWFAFLPNFHNGYDSLDTRPDEKLEHELYIYISADQPTTGTITLKDRNGTPRIEPFVIADPSQIYEFRTYFKPYELLGFNRSNVIDYNGMQTETVAEQSIHIEASADVTVYALNQAALTSDAFLVLPTDALAEDYVVASYTSDIDWAFPTTPVPASSSTPSQFCVVATVDNTLVTIQPSAPTFLSPVQEEQTIQLMKGQSYLVQVDPRLTKDGDLTGSVVRASKPVAVFGGHQRAVVPIEDQSMLGSRDCLIEQMNPVRTWGKSAFIFPLALSADEVRNSSSRFRVIAAFDSTNVFVANTQVAMLNSGQFYEGRLDQAVEVSSTKPTMVSMLKKTAGDGGSVFGSRIGDPFMMLVPPAEQFMKSYRFTNAQANTYTLNPFNGSVTKGPVVYVEQYLAVVIPAEGLPTLTLDGVAIGDARFQPIPGTGYSWATISMKDGKHEISSDTTFGIYVYGYGEANSYGYIGGMAFRPLDVQPPTFSGKPECGRFTGTIADSVIGDTRLKTAIILPGSEVNVSATIAPFDPPSRIVPFTASLVNPFEDGAFAIEATDNVRQTSSIAIDVPGFTVGAAGQGGTSTVTVLSRVTARNRTLCDTVLLENYGKFPRTITSVRTVLGAIVTTPPLPITLAPGQLMPVQVCMRFDSAGIITDTLVLEDSCRTRATHAILTDVRADDKPPYTTLTAPPCSDEYLATVGDDRAFDYGLLSCTIMQEVLSNCTVSETDRTAYTAKYNVHVQDPFNDAVYGFRSTDSAGNSNDFVDTIPGFTLAFEGIGADTINSTTMRSEELGAMRCDSVWLTNYGYFPQVISSVFVKHNLVFSLPQNQFPITIMPGDRVPLTVCYQPQHTSEVPDYDTLVFAFGCLLKNLEVIAEAEPAGFSGLSRCNVTIQTKHFAIGGLMVSPNPSQDVVTVTLPIPTTSIEIRLVTMQGAEVVQHRWSGTSSNGFKLDLSAIPAGTYVLVAHYGTAVGSNIITIR